jgi:hypothetical protein
LGSSFTCTPTLKQRIISQCIVSMSTLIKEIKSIIILLRYFGVTFSMAMNFASLTLKNIYGHSPVKMGYRVGFFTAAEADTQLELLQTPYPCEG